VNGLLIGIEPVIVRLPLFTLRWSGLLFLSALLAGLWLAWRLAEQSGFSRRLLVDLSSWTLLFGFLGARLFSVVASWEYYVTRPSQVPDSASGGLDLWGGIVVGGGAAWLLCRRWGQNIARLADATAPGLALADAVGRVGCFLDGNGQGQVSPFFWATRYASSDALTPDLGLPRHPAQLYQGVADLAMLGLFWLLRHSELPDGVRFWLWLALYGLSRVTIGLVGLDPPFLLGLQQAQLIGLLAIGLSGFGMLRASLKTAQAAT